MEDHANLPDEIYLVESALDRWTVRLMKYDENFLSGQDWTEFNSAELADVTAAGADDGAENGGAKVVHGSGGIWLAAGGVKLCHL